MSTALLVQAFAPPEGWFPKNLNGIIPDNHYEPICPESLSLFMASAWAYEQMVHYGKFAQQGCNERGGFNDDVDIKILIILCNRASDAADILSKAFWSKVAGTTVAFRQVDRKMELVLKVEPGWMQYHFCV